MKRRAVFSLIVFVNAECRGGIEADFAVFKLVGYLDLAACVGIGAYDVLFCYRICAVGGRSGSAETGPELKVTVFPSARSPYGIVYIATNFMVSPT